MKKIKEKKSAYITIITVITISAISIAIIISLITSGILSTKNSLSIINLTKAKSLANACAEEALQNIHDNNNYSGNLNLSFSDGSCLANTTRISDSNFIINVIASSSSSIKKITITVSQTYPKIVTSDWNEVSDF